MKSYRPHSDFIATARLTPELYRLIFGVIAIELLYGLGLDFIGAVLTSLPPQVSDAYYYGTTAAGLLAQLFSFALLGGSVILVARHLNFRRAMTLIGPPAIARQGFLLALVAGLGTFVLLEILPPYWSTFLEVLYKRLGHPEEDAEFLMSRSPITKVDQIRIPMLIAQGANDPRVKQAESEQIVAAMEEKGIDHEYMLFEDEGHGFAKPENRIEFYAAAEKFLAKHLGGRFEPAAGEEAPAAEGAAH